MKTKEKILDYLRKKPMSTAEEIIGGLGIERKTVIVSLNALTRKGKVDATSTWPAKYSVLPKKPIKGDNGQGFVDYGGELTRKCDELKAENNRLRSELDECRKKLTGLAQRIVRQNIYGNH
jgi:hypothetical protein